MSEGALAESLRAQLAVKERELEDAWKVIPELRRRLYVTEVMRDLYRGRLEEQIGDEASNTESRSE